MKSGGNLIGSCCLPGYLFKKGFSFDFDDSTHIVTVEGMRDLVGFDFPLVIEFNNLTEVVGFGGVTLFDYDFDDILALELFAGNNRHIDDADLRNIMCTSSLL